MNSKDLRILITKYKEANQMSNYDVGLEIGISQNTVRRFISGEDILPSTLEKIEKFFTRDCEEKTELEKLKEENALLKESLLKKSETEQALQCALEENKELKTVYVSKSVIEKLDKAEKYESALEEINLILDELKQQYDYMADYSEIKEIQEKINEVLS